MSWKRELIKLGSEYPELRKHLRPILDKSAGSSPVSRDLQDLIVGNKIFTMKQRVADQAQKVLLNNGLYPSVGGIFFKEGKAVVSITCEAHSFVDNPTQGDIDYVCKRVGKNVNRLGYRVDVEGRQDNKGQIIISIYQDLK